MNHNGHYIGSVNWVNQPPEFFAGVTADVKRYFTDKVSAIYHDDRTLALDITFQAILYTAQMVRNDEDIFEGWFSAHDDHGKHWKGAVMGRLFTGPTGLFFFGSWMEDPSTGTKDTWWADLRPDTASDRSVA